MANTYRHRLEYDKPRRFACISTVAPYIGDLLYWDAVAVSIKPAESLPYTTKADAQKTFAKNFVGMSSQYSPTGDAHINPIIVETSGIVEMDCVSGTYKYGDLVAPTSNSGGTALESQKVEKVTDSSLAIGRVMRTENSAVTSLYIELFPPKAQPVSLPKDNEYLEAHTVTSGEGTAGYADIDTGFGVAPNYLQVTVLKVTTGEVKSAYNVTCLSGGSAGIVRIADGSVTTIDAGDIIHFCARM